MIKIIHLKLAYQDKRFENRRKVKFTEKLKKYEYVDK